MIFRVCSWNINSVRLRIDQVVRLLEDERPDILCLQETKCPPGQFPSSALHAIGYHHIHELGQSGYHGVAIISRHPFADCFTRDFCAKGDARYVGVKCTYSNIVLHNFYVPAGGDIPDPSVNDKFEHKIQFLKEMRDYVKSDASFPNLKGLLLGDLNIAPLENDVWSHKALIKEVSHTPEEVELLNEVLGAGSFSDSIRQVFPEDRKVYSWWSYRAKDWAASDRGRRLDHIWARGGLENGLVDARIKRDCRNWQKCSDHVPVIADFDLSVIK